MPARTNFSVCWSMWNCISSSIPPSSPRRRRIECIHCHAARIRRLIDSSLQAGIEDQVHGPGHTLPMCELTAEVPPAFTRQRVVACAAVVLGDLPLGMNQPLALETVECRIERALPQLEDTFRPLFDALGDAPPVHRLELQSLQHEHVERALEDVAAF